MSTVVHSNYVIDKYPTSCKECPFYHETAYKDNAYEGRQGGCLLGYMRHCDMREYNSSQLFDKCDIANDNRVVAVSTYTETENGRDTDYPFTCQCCATPLHKLSVVVSGDVGYPRDLSDSTVQNLYRCPKCHRVYSF